MIFIVIGMINRLVYSVLLFLIIFSIVHYLKPGLIYNEKGGFRQFGLGYKQKTVVPIWVFSIVLAVLCYLTLFYVDKYTTFHI
jgi:hypothetical protein